MSRIDDFITKLESNQTTPNERRDFISSLNKKEFAYFLKKDFTEDRTIANLMQRMFGNEDISMFTDNRKSVSARSDLFEEYLNQTEQLIKKFSIEDIKKILPKIKTEYVTIRNMFLEHLIHLVHNSKEELDIKKIVDFKSRVEHKQVTPEDIRSTLLRMSKEEFSCFICLGNQETNSLLSSLSLYDMELEKMYEYQIEIIAEIIEDYTEDEIIEIMPFLSSSSSKIRTMFFKCLNEKRASELFLTNAPAYSKDIYNYMMTPTSSQEKDNLIIRILSDVNLYSLFSEIEILHLKSLISNPETILDENSNVINTYEEDIKSEAAKYIANIRGRDKKGIKNGILKKLSAKKLHDLLNEVNKGLVNISEEPISYEEFVSLMEIPLDKTILFIRECVELTEEEKKSIINKIYPDNEYSKLSINDSYIKVLNKYSNIVINGTDYKEKEFPYCYQDMLELSYNKNFFDDMLTKYTSNLFVTVSSDCMNIFLSQLIEKIIKELDIEVTKEFYTGRAAIEDKPNQHVTLGSFIPSKSSIVINTNAYTELSKLSIDTTKEKLIRNLLQKISMIETVFHELRHAYQQDAMKDISTMRDFYFMLDQILQQKSSLSRLYYEANYQDDSREVDANLYAKVATANLFRKNPYLKKLYWDVFGPEARKLAKQRKSPQLRKKWSFETEEEKRSIVDIFSEEVSSYRIKQLAEEYPMLAIITDDGYVLGKEELIERYMAVEQALKDNDYDSVEDYEYGKAILDFLRQYLNKIHNQQMVVKKVA